MTANEIEGELESMIKSFDLGLSKKRIRRLLYDIYCKISNDLTEGTELIRQERERQIKIEGWTPEHDDQHTGGEMINAAACYLSVAITAEVRPDATRYYCAPPRYGVAFWSWADEWWKPSDDPRTNLVKAGALIAAELDRIARAALGKEGDSHGAPYKGPGYAVATAVSSAESAKTVPMELVERLRHQGIHTREWIVELFAKFGYTVTESGKEEGR